ncbi:hydroxysqualene dehydroxylase HpnE [Stieleria sp. JC731]|uniref:hydroxysqualene dehydroxylase HpnE n=1 Tax=Pirellulaceae TaxID=2691357 RepID=UPI001E291A58|nr:hydroxysqualene dehydroxylase HpnE [Stieleria sp. JC731]MCC9599609.1 hydroxysqualene dehydroxylase HpnE [Stieleria sp. JC731]
MSVAKVSGGEPVVIVGGGLAGLSAAESISRLSPDRPVVVLEAKRRTGGRTGSFDDPQNGEVDYCQHVAMGCCLNFLDLMKGCGLDRHLRRSTSLTFLHPDYPPSRFAPSRWLPAPLHLLPSLNQLAFLTSPQRREVKRGLLKLLRCPAESLRNIDAASWLRKSGQSDQTIRHFWDVILVSALGEQSDRVSMAAARKVLVDGFAIARGASDVLVPTRPLAELFGRAVPEELKRRGVCVQTGAVVKCIREDRTVEFNSEARSIDSIKASAVICAVPWFRVGTLFDRWPAGKPGQTSPQTALAGIESIATSPISGVHLWFDRPIMELEHAVLVGTVSQWIFRDPIELDDQPNGEVTPRHSYYYQVIISASADATSMGTTELVERVHAELRQFFHAAIDAKLLRSRVVTDPNSVFSISPLVDSLRPSTATSVEWLCLAGDWVQTHWPATMEGAVISGRMAARAVLSHLGVSRQEPIPQRPPAEWLAKLLVR